MKYLVAVSLFTAIFTASCSNNTETSKQNITAADTATSQITVAASDATPEPPPVNDVVTAYLGVKEALANDNGNEAASAANKLSDALNKVTAAALPATQKGVYADVADDMKEHAAHIAANNGKIEHQREHFETLSNDLYDLVKAGSVKQTLYKDFCPMYNNNKGGVWLSETKEIKNPYLGKKMSTCGEVKEEIAKK